MQNINCSKLNGNLGTLKCKYSNGTVSNKSVHTLGRTSLKKVLYLATETQVILILLFLLKFRLQKSMNEVTKNYVAMGSYSNKHCKAYAFSNLIQNKRQVSTALYLLSLLQTE